MRVIFSAIVLTSLVFGTAAADIAVVRIVESDGFGGFGASKKDLYNWIAADKQREEQKSEGKPSMMERMSGAGRPVITRLDKKLRWTLNEPKKTYEESPLVQPVEKSSEKQAASEPADGPAEKPTVKITKAEFKVTPLGQKKQIAGFACDGYEMRAELEMEDLETRQRSGMKMISMIWSAPETGDLAKLKKEEDAYSKAYAQAIGITDSAKAGFKMLGGAMIAALAGAGEKELAGSLSKMPEELKKVKGYPVSMRVEWYSTGDDAESGADSAAEESAEIPTDVSGVSDALGGFAAGFAKKKMDAKRPAATKEGRLVMGMTTTLKSVSTAPLAGTTFEVPTGFKKGH